MVKLQGRKEIPALTFWFDMERSDVETRRNQSSLNVQTVQLGLEVGVNTTPRGSSYLSIASLNKTTIEAASGLHSEVHCSCFSGNYEVYAAGILELAY